MNILIVGGAGFLGSNLVRRCLNDEANSVTVVDSLEPRLKSDIVNLADVRSEINFIKGDICDLALMEGVVKGKDVIFNCAGQTSHPLSLVDPFLDIEINCKGNMALLESARKYNKNALIIFTSSSTVIGRAKEEIVDETHGESPLDIYSANKSVAEKYYRVYSRVYELKTLSLRFANLYGPYGKGYPEFGFINYFIHLARNNMEIQIYGDGRQNRNVMFVEDAVNLLYECIFHKEIFGDVYFAVHREHYPVIDIAREIVSVFGKGAIKNIPWPDIRKRIEIDNVVISAERLYSAIRWEPKYSLRQGLVKTREIMEKVKVAGSPLVNERVIK